MVTFRDLFSSVKNIFKSNQTNKRNNIIEEKNKQNNRNQQNKRKYQQNIENKKQFYEKIKNPKTTYRELYNLVNSINNEFIREYENQLYEKELKMKPYHKPLNLNTNLKETLKSSSSSKNTKKQIRFGTQQIRDYNNNVTLEKNPIGKEEIEYLDFVSLPSSAQVQKNNRKHRKKEKRLLDKKEGRTNVNLNEYYLNIKKGKIPVFVNKFIESGDRISDSILRTEFYIKADKTIGDLEDMVENYINTLKSNREKVHIQLYVYNQANKTELADRSEKMEDIFNKYRNENGILDINYEILGPAFQIVDL